MIFNAAKQTILNMKMAVFWVMAQCSLVEFTDVSEVLSVSIIRAMRPDDGGSKDL
jgi:hypothetical protein